MKTPDYLFVLPKLRVQNANLVSGPMSWGFPSPTAAIGFADALDRYAQAHLNLRIHGVGIVAHAFAAQASKPGAKPFNVLHLTRNPVRPNGDPRGIIEEGRAHLELSLIFGVGGDGVWSGKSHEAIARDLGNYATTQRFAGGSIVGAQAHRAILVAAAVDESIARTLRRRLMPGFALVSREAVLAQRTRELRASTPSATPLDALLDFSRLNHVCERDSADPIKGRWSIAKKPGWFVPIASGYRAITRIYSPGEIAHTRDAVTPFRFVESIYTLGEWVSPHRIDDLTNALWYPNYNIEHGLYQCTTPHYSQETLEQKDELHHGH